VHTPAPHPTAMRFFLYLLLSASTEALRITTQFRCRPFSQALGLFKPGLGGRVEEARTAFEAPSDSILDAVDRAPGRRLAASDAAALAGTDLNSAAKELLTLASLTQGNLDVTNDGEIIYSFSPDYRTTLQLRSPTLKARRLWQTVSPYLFSAVRVSFALALFSSLVIVATALLAAGGGGAGGSSNNNNNNKREKDSDSSKYSSRPPTLSMNLFSPLDTLTSIIQRQNRYYEAQSEKFPDALDEYSQVNKGAPPVSGLESFFSFVFGDGNPNTRFSQAQLLAVAEKIRRNDGIVIAEDLAPYLDPPTPSNSENTTVVTESWVLPAVVNFGGVPMVSENGNIYYAFSDLAATALADNSEKKGNRKALATRLVEQPVPFSRASLPWKFCAAALGSLNIWGVSLLRTQMRSPEFLLKLPVMRTLYPWLSVYAGLYVLVPIVRSILLVNENSEIEARNSIRESWVESSVAELDDKRADVLSTARKNGLLDKIKKNISSSGIYFSSSPKGKE